MTTMFRHFLLGVLFLAPCLLLAQPDRRADPADLPAWMAELITGETPKTALKTTAKPVHTNAFVGTWIMRVTGGKRLLYWGDEHRMIIQEVQGMDTPVRTTLVDLQASVSAVLYPNQGVFVGKVRDLYHPQQGYFLELWSDSVVATGKRDTLMNEVVTEYKGTNSNGGTICYWRTTAYPKLFADLRVWGPWLREGEVKYLSAFNNKRTGPAIRVAWDGPQYTPTKGEVTFHKVTPGKQPMPKLGLAGAMLLEERLLWVNATQIGRLPPWMRERLNRLPEDSLPLAYTPPAINRGIPDNQFVGTLTARSLSRWTDHEGTKDQVGTFTYWADARRAILTVDAPHEKGKWTYMVDLDHDVAIVSRNAGHDHVIPKVEITTLQDAGLMEFGDGVDLPFTPTGTKRKILGRNCELYTTTERYLSRYWFSEVTTPNPIHDMARWMEPKPSQVFKDLMFFGVKNKPMPFAVMATELTSFKPGKVPPPVIDLSDHWVKDHRLDSHKRSRSYDREPRVAMDGETVTDSDSPREVSGYQGVEEAVPMLEGAAGGSGSTHSPRSAPITTPFPKEILERTMNKFRGNARLKFRMIDKRDTTEWIVDYTSTHERMVLVRTPVKNAGAHTAMIIHRKAGDETRCTLDPSTGNVTMEPTRKLRTTHPPTDVNPLLYYATDHEQNKVLGRICDLYIHDSANGRRSAFVTEAPASLFLDLFSARKGWDGIEEFIQGKFFGLGMEGLPLFAEGRDERMVHVTMEVVSLDTGPVDPNVFRITPDSWK
jgi:hypothetical protein